LGFHLEPPKAGAWALHWVVKKGRASGILKDGMWGSLSDVVWGFWMVAMMVAVKALKSAKEFCIIHI
jgi:hypothetical protein